MMMTGRQNDNKEEEEEECIPSVVLVAFLLSAERTIFGLAAMKWSCTGKKKNIKNSESKIKAVFKEPRCKVQKESELELFQQKGQLISKNLAQTSEEKTHINDI